jgi:hypothetical protein
VQQGFSWIGTKDHGTPHFRPLRFSHVVENSEHTYFIEELNPLPHSGRNASNFLYFLDIVPGRRDEVVRAVIEPAGLIASKCLIAETNFDAFARPQLRTHPS